MESKRGFFHGSNDPCFCWKRPCLGGGGGLTPSKIEVIGAKQGDSLPHFHTLSEKILKNAASIDHGLGFV